MRARRSIVAQLACLGALAVGGLTASACEPPPRRVLVIGDSLTVGAMKRQLGRPHPATWIIVAAEGLGTNGGIAVAKGESISSYDQVVVALGTNDYSDTKAAYAARIDNMMATLGSKVPVLWINVDVGTAPLAQAALGVNPALAAAPGRHPKLRVANWSAVINARSDEASLRAGDGVHYTAAGYEVRARWMESLVAA